MKLSMRPLTPERWADIDALFNARGCSVARGCWCMYYRQSGSAAYAAYDKERATKKRRELKALVDGGNSPGLIGYRGKTAVGWISLGPREQFKRLERSPVMKPVDDQPVWSIVCFVVPSEFRGQGVAQRLLDGAIPYAKKQGAKILEAYPVDKPVYSRNDSLWFGTKSMYDAAGFVEVARRKPERPVLRLTLK